MQSISKRKVSAAGSILINPKASKEEYKEAIQILDHWRKAHQDPLSEISRNVIKISENIESISFASRLKRKEAILSKLKRKDNNFDLKTMDDIAGCRITVPDLQTQKNITDQLKHLKGWQKEKNYVETPTSKGYRAIHLFFNLDSRDYNYKNLRVELQIRTELQHAWATAVEVYDLIKNDNLKSGNGNKQAQRYFYLTSYLFANLLENKSKKTNDNKTIQKYKSELQHIENEHNFLKIIEQFNASLFIINNKEEIQAKGDGYYLIKLDLENGFIDIKYFPETKKEYAESLYTELETKITPQSHQDVLLVKAKSYHMLALSYPNYSAKIQPFIDAMQKILN